MEFFKAGVQYGDWEGTAAADDRDPHSPSLRRLLEEKGLIEQGELLVAATVYFAEYDYNTPHVQAIVIDSSEENVQEINTRLAGSAGPIPVRTIGLDLTTEEFLKLFKRFSVKLTLRGLELEDREYRSTD